MDANTILRKKVFDNLNRAVENGYYHEVMSLTNIALAEYLLTDTDDFEVGYIVSDLIAHIQAWKWKEHNNVI